MMKSRGSVITYVCIVALGLGAGVGEAAAQTRGTGIVLDSLTGLTLPVIGQLGTVKIDQAVVTNFALIENTVGQIVGLQVDGVLQFTASALGTNVLTQNFTTTVNVTSSGPGQCNIVNIDLGQITIDALAASVDVPAATLTAKGSGAVGSLLCNLGNLLTRLTSGIGGTGAIGSIVNQLNGLI